MAARLRVKIFLTLRYFLFKKTLATVILLGGIVALFFLGSILDQTRMTGTASWYGKKFHGRKTANGEIYDKWAMTAAHRHLPFDTIIRVKNLENNEEVVVRINDRGPYWPGRIIDLSRGAAEKINMRKKGLARVNLKIIKP